MLEGSVRTAAHQLRVASRLVDAETGAVLWSQAYDDDLGARSFFAIQDDVAQKVATTVGQPYGIISRADGRREQATAPEEASQLRRQANVAMHPDTSTSGHEGQLGDEQLAEAAPARCYRSVGGMAA